MFAAIRQRLGSVPITACLLAVSVSLYVAASVDSALSDAPLAGRHHFGSVEGLVLSTDDGKVIETFGPFELWEGPWWRWARIPVSAFHHGGLLHLVCNAWTLWVFGDVVERRMHPLSYLVFWMSSAVVSLLPEYYLSHCPIGLSGVACALFGWCVAQRDVDSRIANWLHAKVLIWFAASLYLGLFLTALSPIQIANVAHVTGVAYGWLVARAARSRVGFATFAVGHALLPLAVWGVLHPVWEARYHTFIGIQKMDHGEPLSAAILDFQTAVRLDPAMPNAWRRLAESREREDDKLGAWRYLIDGLSHNRTNSELASASRKMWQRLPETDRTVAREWLQQCFGDEAAAWAEQLKITAEPLAESAPESNSPPASAAPAKVESSDNATTSAEP